MLGGRFSQAFFFSIQTFATIGYGQIAPNGTGGKHRGHRRSAGRPHVSGARHGPALRALHAADRGAPLQPARRRRAVQRRPGADVPDREPAPQRNHRARGAGAVQRDRARRPRRPRAALHAAGARAEQGDVLSALVDDRASDRRAPARWRGGRARISSARRRRSSSCCPASTKRLEQTVHARSSYRADEIVWNARFQSMFLPADARSRVAVDISRVHDIEPL